MEKALCIYSSSSDAVDQHFFEAAKEMGSLIARNHYALIYGGAKVGLMGAVARAVQEHGGKVIGVIPQALREKGIAFEQADELIVANDMRHRKAIMEERATAFAGLPGGFGTLEEILEILTLKQLQFHAKSLVLLNVNGFYDPLILLFEHIYRERFAKADYRHLYHVAANVTDLFEYLEGYQPPRLQSKWF